MNEEQFATVTKNASAVARRYKRRCWWASVEDLEQEAIRAQVEALEKSTFDPERGTPSGAYLWAVALYSARRLLLKSSAPVSTEHRMDNLVGLYREVVPDGDGSIEFHLDSFEELVHRRDLARRVRERVLALVGAQCAHFALAVISDEVSPADVAAHNQVPATAVYEMQKAIKKVLEHDQVLNDLWRSSR